MKDEGARFVLVDDDEVDVMAVRRAFARERMEGSLVVARDGLEALDYLRGAGSQGTIERPYIVLLDLSMPRMGGIEFLKELRGDPDHRDAIVFVLTSTKDERQKAEAYRFNVAGYVVKSGSMEDFFDLAKMLNLFRRLVDPP